MTIKTCLLASALTTIGATAAIADTVVVARENGVTDDRIGIVIGGSVDGGNMGCQTKSGDDCGNGAHPAGGFSFHVGGMVSPVVAVLGEVWGMAHTDDNVTASQVLATANIRVWAAPRLWLQGGIGVARSKISYGSGDFMASDVSDTVPAFMGAIGLEVIRTPQFGLDLELRGGSGFYQSDVRIYNAALGVGASWY